MKVKALLRQKDSDVFTIEADKSICQCIDVLNQRKIGALIVVNHTGKMVGIISERDILRTTMAKQGNNVCSSMVRDVMTPQEKLLTVTEDESLYKVMEIMTKNRVRHIPVVRDGNIFRIISIGDVIKFLLDQAMLENEEMKNYISSGY